MARPKKTIGSELQQHHWAWLMTGYLQSGKASEVQAHNDEVFAVYLRAQQAHQTYRYARLVLKQTAGDSELVNYVQLKSQLVHEAAFKRASSMSLTNAAEWLQLAANASADLERAYRDFQEATRGRYEARGEAQGADTAGNNRPSNRRVDAAEVSPADGGTEESDGAATTGEGQAPIRVQRGRQRGAGSAANSSDSTREDAEVNRG